jgi:hypothetical protein
MRLPFLYCAGAGLVAGLICAEPVHAQADTGAALRQDSVAAVAPVSARRILENELVRAYDLLIPAGTVESGFHEHRIPYVYVSMGAGTLRIRKPDGSSEGITYAPGQTLYGVAERHAVDNVGNALLHFVIIDLKPGPR